MTKEKIIKLMECYQTKLNELGYKPVELEGYDLKYSETNQTLALNHTYWMCHKIIDLVNNNEIEKANRWLGFVQGVFWTTNIFSINEMRDQNRD